MFSVQTKFWLVTLLEPGIDWMFLSPTGPLFEHWFIAEVTLCYDILQQGSVFDKEEAELSLAIMTYWTNFAATG